MAEKAKTGLLRLLWPLVAVAPSVVAMRGAFSAREVFAYRDNLQLFFPLHRWFRRSLEAGDWPLWDPYSSFGQSAVADPLRHIFFLPALLLRLIPSDVLGYNLLIALPLPLSALGVYVLLRPRLSKSAAALGGIVFSTSSTMLSTANMPNLSWSMAIAPFTVWALSAAGARRTSAWLALAGAVVGLQALAGEPVTLAATLAVAVVYAAVSSSSTTRSAVTALARAALAIVSGCLLAAVQYLPLLDAVRLSNRETLDLENNLYWSLHPFRLLELVVPFPFNDPMTISYQFDAWSTRLTSGREPLLASHYVGVAAIALAVLGAVTGERRRSLLWVGIGIAGVVCALGASAGIYPVLLAAIPPLRSFRFPEKYVLFTVFAIACLAAEGWDGLVTQRCSRRAVWVALATLALLLAAVAAAVALAPTFAAAIDAGPDAATHTRFVVVREALPLVALASGKAGVLAWLARRSERSGQVQALGIALVALDLLMAGAWLNPQVDVALVGEPSWVARTVSADARAFVGYTVTGYLLNQENTDAAAIDADPDAFRLTVSSPPGAPYHVGEALIMTNLAAEPSQWRLRTAFSADVPRLLPTVNSVFADQYVAASRERRARALDRVGVRTQLRTKPPAAGDYGAPEPVPSLGTIAAYFSSKPFERVFVSGSARVEPDAAAAMRTLFDDEPEPAVEVAVDRDVAPAGVPGAAGAPSVRVLEDRPSSMRVEATAAEGALLVVLDSYNAGWQAEVDGQGAEIARVDGLFRGVRLAPGTHTVSFEYRPKSLVIGSWITIAAAAVLVGIAAVSLTRRRARGTS